MTRELFMLFLVLASVLGGVMGACLWSLRGQGDDSGEHSPLPGDANAGGAASGRPGGVPVEHRPAEHRPDERRPTERHAQDRSRDRPRDRHAMDRHAEAQSRRIASLVAELQAAEEQQMRLQRDLATLRAARQHGGESLRSTVLDQDDDLPVLNRRVAAGASVTDADGRAAPRAVGRRQASGSELLGLSLALDSTAEIPVLSEEELANSIDDLDLELIGEGGRKNTHG